MRHVTVVLPFLAAAYIPTVFAQEKPTYSQEFCVKVNPGKAADTAAMISDAIKLNQVRIDEGGLSWFTALTATIPAGTSARCDYKFVYGYEGFPPEPLTRAESEALFAKAKIAGTYAQLLARRDANMTLVSDDLWRRIDSATIGANSAKGSYLRFNLFKIKPGHTLAEWTKLETDGWKPFAEARAKETPGFGWRVVALSQPTGSSLHYNAMTVDIYPTWTASGQGASLAIWNKVHPDLPANDYLAKVNDVVDRYKAELYRVVDVVRKK